MNKRHLTIAIIIQLCAIATVIAQPKPNNAVQLQAGVSIAIAKGYPASILMWEVDPLSHTRQSAQFSGVVVSKEGEILSAAHVVMPGKSYQVMFPDGRECFAKGLGRIAIPPTFMQPDAAMLKITDKGPWPFAEMGWSSSLTANQPCISIAYPESLEQRKPSVRYGRISELKNKYGFLQSTCVMEPGDSGGPLFDLLGRVIGIHSGIEVSEDVNYEIPIDTYRRYYTALSHGQNFSSLPADTNVIINDPLITAVRAISPATCLDRGINNNKKFGASCVRITSAVDGKEELISGTVLSLNNLKGNPLAANGLVISKSSMVGDAPEIRLQNGKTTRGIILMRDRANDLVLITSSIKIGKGVMLNDSASGRITFHELGRQLISPRPDSAARAGVLSSMLISLPQKTSYGYLGAITGFRGARLVLISVEPGSAANSSDLQVSDEIEAIDGLKVTDELDFVRALGKYRAGDSAIVTLSRAGQKMQKHVLLKYPPQKAGSHPAERFEGGKSIRRDGFDQVFVQDARIKPSDCGGPVFDADGNFVGLNIARLSRTGTAVLPASKIRKILNGLLK
jgi:serine protease Do